MYKRQNYIKESLTQKICRRRIFSFFHSIFSKQKTHYLMLMYKIDSIIHAFYALLYIFFFYLQFKRRIELLCECEKVSSRLFFFGIASLSVSFNFFLLFSLFFEVLSHKRVKFAFWGFFSSVKFTIVILIGFVRHVKFEIGLFYVRKI